MQMTVLISAFALPTGWCLVIWPAAAPVPLALLGLGTAALLVRGGFERRATATLVVLCGFAVFAPAVGERDRNRNEASAIGALRAIQSAESLYASTNGGYYDTLECLITPCVPGIGGSLLDSNSVAGERRGYRLEFYPGPKVHPGPGQRTSGSAMTGFAIVARPLDSEALTGRVLCGDASGSIYVTAHGTVPRVDGGRCLDTASPLR